ncbi:MAG: phytoene/squalene synthase family protein [Bryobacteraceae bacterium]|nr:phytoene/squalene synthase family protein [Bryobacteraceae bacterium]MDW8378516.1 phytoene/squalene synthase family protein [Bryobacterales bacterium]
MRTDSGAQLAELYQEASRITAQGSKSFYFATRFFPKPLAQSAYAVYWFCRYTDDLVDEAPSSEIASQQLEHWAALVEKALREGASDHPILKLFLDAAAKHGIPAEYPLELIEGMRMDARRTRYENFQQLRLFCYRVASVVGLMMSHVIGFRPPALEHAIDLGIAMQLTNILRDIGEDLRRDRIYLPSEEMERFGYSEGQLRSRMRNDAFLELMAFQVARARHYYDQALPGIALLNPEGRFAVKVAADVYAAILSQIEVLDYDVFERRAVVPAGIKYWLTAKSLALPVARHSLTRMAFWRG